MSTTHDEWQQQFRRRLQGKHAPPLPPAPPDLDPAVLLAMATSRERPRRTSYESPDHWGLVGFKLRVKQQDAQMAERGTRTCVLCEQELPADEFRLMNKGGRMAYCIRCRECDRKLESQRRAKVRD